jgi:HEAT repeat protein
LRDKILKGRSHVTFPALPAMNRFCKISLAFVMLTTGCRRPPPPKVTDEKRESISRSEDRPAKPRPSEVDPSVYAKPAAKSKTAGDWMVGLKSPDAARRIEAAEALGKMARTGAMTGPVRQEAVSALLTTLSDERSYVRRSAVEALSQLAPEAKSAMPHLIAKLEFRNELAGNQGDPSSEVRREIILALSRIDPESKAALAPFGKSLRDPDNSVSQSATEVLVHIGKSGAAHEEAVAIFVTATTDKDLQLCLRSIAALGLIGGDRVIPPLAAAVKRKEPMVRKKAVESLTKVSPKHKAVVPALLEALKEADGDVRHYAIEILGSIGAEAKLAMPILIETLNDRDMDIRIQAVRALVRIDPKSKDVVPSLQKMLSDSERDVRLEVLDALGQCGKPAVGPLMESLKDLDSNILVHAEESLGRIGPEAKEAVPNLLLLLKDDTEEVRNVAAAALKKIQDGASSHR